LEFWEPTDSDLERSAQILRENIQPLVPSIKALSEGRRGGSSSDRGGDDSSEDTTNCPKEVKKEQLKGKELNSLAGAYAEKNEILKGNFITRKDY
jgi:hypothetical protein